MKPHMLIELHPTWPRVTIREVEEREHDANEAIDAVVALTDAPRGAKAAGRCITFTWTVGAGKPFESARRRADALAAACVTLGYAYTRT